MTFGLIALKVAGIIKANHPLQNKDIFQRQYNMAAEMFLDMKEQK